MAVSYAIAAGIALFAMLGVIGNDKVEAGIRVVSSLAGLFFIFLFIFAAVKL